MTAYAATMIVSPPALTLEAVRALLLPLAQQAGFTEVTLSHHVCAHPHYEAAAKAPGRYACLVGYPWECTSLALLLEAATETLDACFAELLEPYAHV